MCEKQTKYICNGYTIKRREMVIFLEDYMQTILASDTHLAHGQFLHHKKAMNK
jgi:hypothetical protein